MIEIMKASAGSGKTYSLAGKYIGLLLKSDDRYAYRHILAVTFTNKATDEMKSRIMKELFILSTEPEKSGYHDRFVPSLFPSDSDLRSKAEHVLHDILHDYSAFAPVFTQNGFDYQPHLNVKITCDTWQDALNRMDTNRRRVLKNLDEWCNCSIVESLNKDTINRFNASVANKLSTQRECSEQIIDSPHHRITESPYYCYATTKEQVRQYYALLRQHYKTKVRKPLFPYAFFESLVTSQTGKLLLLYTADKLIGGMIQVELPGKVVYDYYACALDEAYKELSPSVLLYGITMQQAINDGIKVFDTMGAGKPDIPYGVRDFKLRFGGTLVQEGRFLLLHRPFLYKMGAWAVKFFS